MNDFKEKLTDFLLGTFGIIWVIILMVFGVVQIWIGFLGIDYHLGGVFAFGALGLAFLLRIMFPLTIGTYFGVVDVIGWDWYWGVLITAPGIVFILPGLVTAIIQSLTNRVQL